MARDILGFGLPQPPATSQAQPGNEKARIEALASRYRVPANVLMALAESGANLDDEAARLGQTLAAGKPLDAALSERIGDPTRAEALLNRAYDIADQVYPRPAAPPKEPSLVRDLAAGAGGALVSGVGYGLDYAGATLASGLRQPGIADAAGAVAAPVKSAGTAISDMASPEAQQAAQDSMPTGDILHPSTLGLPKDFSMRGLLQIAAQGVGSMAPAVVASVVSRNPAAAGAVVGGAMGGGAARDQAAQEIDTRWQEKDASGITRLERESDVFRALVAQGFTREQAYAEVRNRSMDTAGNLAAIVAGAGGAATGKILHGVAGGSTRVARGLRGVGASGLEEGIQEVGEGIATNAGINAAAGTDIALGQDSAQNFMGGAVGGGPFGGLAALSPNRAAPQPPPGAGTPPPTEPQNPGADGSRAGPDAAPVVPPNAGAAPDQGPIGPGVMSDVPRETPEAALDALRAFGRATHGAGIPSGSPAARQMDDLIAAAQRVGATEDDIDAALSGRPPAPTGPATRAAALAPDLTPQPEPEAPIQRFPDQKPGAQLRLADPEGKVWEATFLRETPDGVVFRIAGEELTLPAADFDEALALARAADAEAKAAATGKPAQTAPVENVTTRPAMPEGGLADQASAGIKPPVRGLPDAKAPETPAPVQPAQGAGPSQPGGGVVSTGGPRSAQPPLEGMGQVQGERPAGTGVQQTDSGNAGQSIAPLELTEPPTPDRAPWWDDGDDATKKAILKESGLSPRLSLARPFSDLPEKARKLLTDSFGKLYRAGKVDNIGTIEAPRFALRGETIDAVAAKPGVDVPGSPADAQQPALPSPGTVQQAAAETAADPTPAQTEAENYKTGKAPWNGLTLSVENAKDSIRRKVTPDGKTAWEVKMPAHYGRILRTTGADGDHVDFYMGDAEDSQNVWIIDQVDLKSGAFDEHKAMLGMTTAQQAADTYAAGFSDGKGRARMGGITKMTVNAFKEWLASGDMKKPVSRKMKAAANKKQPLAIAPPPEEPPSPPEEDAPKRGPKIKDFGEAIGGMRKAAARRYVDDLDNDAATATLGLSDVFPIPDYEALAAAGVDPSQLAAVAVLRGSIKRKPKKSWQVEDWATDVDTKRKVAKRLLDGSLSWADLEPNLVGSNGYAKRFEGLYLGIDEQTTVPVIARLNPSKMGVAGANFLIGRTRPYTANSPSPTYYFGITGLGGYLSTSTPKDSLVPDLKPESLDKLAFWLDSRVDRLIEEQKRAPRDPDAPPPDVELTLMRRRNSGMIYIAAKEANQVALSDDFPDENTAKAYREANREALVKKYLAMKEGLNERREENRERVGPTWRVGDATEDMFLKDMGFRGVAFGESTTAKQRQDRMNETYDAFMDLAGALDVPLKTLSLNGRLALGFGTHGKGGRGHWAAVYFGQHDAAGNPAGSQDQVIALTTRMGAGTLAHEWFHAVDNFLARKDAKGSNRSVASTGKDSRRHEFMSDRDRSTGALPQETVDAFTALRRALRSSDWAKRMEAVDAVKKKPYFGTTIELAARGFERLVLDELYKRDMVDDFLVNVDERGGAYQDTAEFHTSGIADAFADVMTAIKRELDVEGKNGPKLPAVIEDRVYQGPKVGDQWETADGWAKITGMKGTRGLLFEVTDLWNGSTDMLSPQEIVARQKRDAEGMTDEGRAKKAAEKKAREEAAAKAKAEQEERDKLNAGVKEAKQRALSILKAFTDANGKNHAAYLERLSKRYDFAGKGYLTRYQAIVLWIEKGGKVIDGKPGSKYGARVETSNGIESPIWEFDMTKLGMEFARWYQARWEKEQAILQQAAEAQQDEQAPEPEPPVKEPPAGNDDFDINALIDEEFADTAAPPGEEARITAAFLDEFRAGRGFRTIVQARKAAGEAIGRAVEPADYMRVEEAIELAVVKRAREIVAQEPDPVQAYVALMDLYDRQPILGERVPDKMIFQAYSTPAPLAFVASRLAGIGPRTRVVEPTAGNGMLVMQAKPENVQANELQPTRAAQLRDALGTAATVTSRDALEMTFAPFDVLIANPPFGKVTDQDSMTRKEWPLGATTTKEIDHAIAWHTLEQMPDDGRAVLILGGIKKQLIGEDRAKAYQERAKLVFFKQLYDTYNVVDHFTVAGELYVRQGAAWPVDVIVIDGRAASVREYPMKTAPQVLSTWTEVGRKLSDAPDLDTEGRGTGAAGDDLAGQGTTDQGGVSQPAGGSTVPDDPRSRPGGPEGTGASDAGPRSGGRRPGGRSGNGRPAAGGGNAAGGTATDGLAGASDGTDGQPGPGGSDQGGKPQGLDDGDVRGGLTPGQLASSAVKNTVAGVESAMDGLLGLFGGKNTLSSGLTFSRETYEKAKPFFIQAVKSLGEAVRDLKEMVRAIIRAFKARGATADQVKAMVPYLGEFRDEVASGKLDPWAESKPQPRNGEQETEFQVAYEPRSKARFAVGTLVPRAMQDAMNRALDKIEAKEGDIDAYVAKELGYTLDQVVGTDTTEGYFSAEQIDALAMAIHNVSQNKGFIIGDQTGVGKGRFVAAMLRYGERTGRIPVFVTQKPGLYADMIRDLRDIGMSDAQAKTIATNANLQPVPITGDDDLFVGAKKKDLDALNVALHKGKLPEGKAFLFTTYDQITTTAGKWPPRALALRAAAPNIMLVLDESHTAGGTAAGSRTGPRAPGSMPENRADFFRDLVSMSAGTVFSSATYAKNPTVMSLYSSTDLALSVDNIDKLGPAIESGGVPLQQVAATQLTESGQYVRRERSFAGVDFAPSEMVTKREHAVQVSRLISDMASFDRQHMESIREQVSQQFQEGGFIGVKDNSVGTAGATSAGFGSTVHNLVNQFLLAAKLDAAADAAIAAWKAGEKPVLTLMNVNTSIVDEYLTGLPDEPGKTVSVPFTAIMDRYLERLRYITVETVEGDKIKYRIPDADIGPDVLAIMADLKEQIRTAPLEGLTGSPVDAILDKLRAAGMKVDEITGRQRVIDSGTVGSRVNNSAANKRRMNDFNSGKLDALVLSASGSTGFSLHATGKKGNDGKKRHMIVLQAHADINVFMQTLGRVHRTGQTVLPRYTLAFSDLAIEKRAAAVLMKKMASLNANTTAGKSSATTLTDVTDFINEVGDAVVAAYLREDPVLAMQLGFMLGVSETPPDIARKATGRFIYLTPDEVDAHYDAIEFAYKQRLEQLEAEGTSPLEAKTLDLQARILSSAVLRQGTGGDSPFAAPLVAERVSVKKAGMPYKASKVREKVAETLAQNGGGTGPWFDAKAATIDGMVPGYSQAARDRLADRTEKRDAADLALAAARKKFEDARDLERAAVRNPDQSPEKLSILRKETDAARRFYDKTAKDRQEAQVEVEAAERRIANEAERVSEIKKEIRRYHPGATFNITRGEDEFYAVVLDVDVSKMAGNPTAAGRIRVRFAVADAAREVVFTLNQLIDQAGVSTASARDELAFAAFDAGQSNRREERTIMTGNLIGGVDQFKTANGRVVYYTTEDGEIKAGVLMPGRFDLRAALSDQDVVFSTAEQAARFITENTGVLKSDDRLASITQDGANRFKITVPKKGKSYFQLRAVQPLIETFREQGRNYTGTIRAANLRDVIQTYTENLGTKWVTESHKDEARAIVGIVIPSIEDQESRLEAPRGWGEVEADPPITDADIRKINVALNAEMRRHKLAGKVPVAVVRDVFTRTLFGMERRPNSMGNFGPRGIQVKAGAQAGELGVLRHEIIHALRSSHLWGKPYGLFTQAEWQALVKAARADAELMDSITRRYPDLPFSKQMEEVVAELYRNWAHGQDQKGLVQRAFERIMGFFEGLARALRGEGFADAAMVMERIASGKVGARGGTPEVPFLPVDSEMRGERTKTDTPEFKRWFGDSKVIGPDGEPRVVYHATWADFDRFDRRKSGQNVTGATSKMAATAKVGFWFSDRDLASEIAATTSMPVYLSIQKPKDTDLIALADEIKAAGSVRSYLRALSEEGHDGLIVRDQEFGGNSFVALDPTQIKSVFNRGTFNPADPDISEMRADPLGALKRTELPTGKKRWRWAEGSYWSDLLTDAMAGRDSGRYSALGLVPGRALFSELGGSLMAAKAYLRGKEDMDALRTAWHVRADTVAQDWRKARNADPRANDALMDLMHDTTLDGLDPSKPDLWRHALGKAAEMAVSREGADAPLWAHDVLAQIRSRKANYDRLVARFNALPPAMQAIYRKVRHEYDTLGEVFERTVIENVETATRIAIKRAERDYRNEMRRIRDEGLEGAELDEAVAAAEKKWAGIRARGGWGAKARMAQLRQSFESNRLSGPYFPLSRFGDYFVTVRDEKGAVTSFSRFESRAEQRAWAEEAEKDAPGRVQTGVMSNKEELKGPGDPNFTADVQKILQDAGASAEVMDAVWQRWLESLPDRSIRTNRIHRKGRSGYSRDAFRAFGKHMFHGAHQLARLKYGLTLEEHLNDAEEEARRAADPQRAGLIVNEMRRRHQFTMNPEGSAILAGASGLAFIWYLGLSPAAAAVNAAQTTILAPGILGAKFQKAGVKGASAALARAFKDFGRGKGDTTASPDLTDGERAALAEAMRRGIIDKTQSHDLASVADTGVAYNATRENVMRKIGWMFHRVERMNRETTFLAGYRLARAEGMAMEDAINAAGDATFTVHFDYQNTSRARFMQGDLGRALTMFKQFTVNMLWRLFRDAHQSFAGATGEERREARVQLVAISLSMMAHAGIRGVWGYGLLMMLLSVFLPGDSDDLDDALQDALLIEGDSPGVAAWNWMMGAALNGVPGQVTGLDLTNRIGMPNLWFRGQDRDMEGEDIYAHYVGELLGPVYGIGESLVRGASMAFDGQVQRGVETAVPKMARDLLKGFRYATEGAETMKGDPIIEDMSPWAVVAQMNGFTSAQLAERYRINNRLKNREAEIMDRRKAIHKAIGDALMAGEPIPQQAMDDMRAFNSEFPEYPVTRKTIEQSVRGRQRASQANEFGITLNPKLNARLREEAPQAVYQ